MRLEGEIDEGGGRADGKAGMAWRHTTHLAVATVAGAVEAANFGNALHNGRKVAQHGLYSFCASGSLGNVVW